MTNTIPKRGDVFFCQGSPDAIGSEERKTRPVVIIQNDAGNASSPPDGDRRQHDDQHVPPAASNAIRH